MKVRTVHYPQGTYILIDTKSASMSVLQHPTSTPAETLRQTAQELRDKATNLQHRAAVLEEAALLI